MNEEEYQELLQSIRVEWNKAEKAIKIAENISNEVVIPSIFELRYAGRRVVEALAARSSDFEQAVALFRDAKFDCHRARHDAVDAATTKMIGDLTAAIETLGPGPVMQYFSDFSIYYRLLQEVRTKIAISRENRENRDAIYDTIESVDLVALTELYNSFKACEPLIVAAAVKNQVELSSAKSLAAREGRKASLGIAFGILGLFIGIMSFFL